MSSPSGNNFASIYPFLSSSPADNGSGRLRDAVRDSSQAKIRDVIDLRRQVARSDAARLADCASHMAARFAAGGRLFTFGNGGSSTDAQDLARLFMWPGGVWSAAPAIALTNDIAAVTALTNDIGFEVAFARQLGAFGRAGDIAVGVSTSGNSDNLLRAFDQAKRMGMCTVGLAGAGGGKMADLASIDHLFMTPSASVHRTQEAQVTQFHILWELTVGMLGAGVSDVGVSDVGVSGVGVLATTTAPGAMPSVSDSPAQPSPVPSEGPGGDRT